MRENMTQKDLVKEWTNVHLGGYGYEENNNRWKLKVGYYLLKPEMEYIQKYNIFRGKKGLEMCGKCTPYSRLQGSCESKDQLGNLAKGQRSEAKCSGVRNSVFQISGEDLGNGFLTPTSAKDLGSQKCLCWLISHLSQATKIY